MEKKQVKLNNTSATATIGEKRFSKFVNIFGLKQKSLNFAKESQNALRYSLWTHCYTST